MTPPDDFERFLTRQTYRPPPAAWREEILAAAARERPRRTVLPLSRRATAAWSSLAAAWLVLALIHADTPPAPSVASSTRGPFHAADAAFLLALQSSQVNTLLAESTARARLSIHPTPLP